MTALTRGAFYRSPRCPNLSRSCLLTAEGDGLVLARLAGGWRGPGQADQRLGVGEPGPAVADLGEQPGGAGGARAEKRGEDVAVGVRGELPGDLASSAVIWVFRPASTAARARVMYARAAPHWWLRGDGQLRDGT